MQGIEVFMMRRHLKSDFVGGAFVFPGGVVDPADEIDDRLCAGRTDASASAALGISRGGLAYWIAAIRECFEEAGILLAYDREGGLLDFRQPDVKRRYEAYRAALNAGEITLDQIAQREGLKAATDRIHYWAHWITPEGQPLRYDARFFLAVAPKDQIAEHDGRELTDSAWVSPQAALEKARTKEWTIIFPTLRNLMLLLEFTSAGEAEAAARAQREVAAVLPRVMRDGRGVRLLVPGDEGYEQAGDGADASDASNFADPNN
jgi:8-oxo-dGTP pyrophosphatase MutT (NUDIX family)